MWTLSVNNLIMMMELAITNKSPHCQTNYLPELWKPQLWINKYDVNSKATRTKFWNGKNDSKISRKTTGNGKRDVCWW